MLLLTQDLVSIVGNAEKENFKESLKDALEGHLDYVTKIEKKLSDGSDFNFLKDGAEQRKGGNQTLEKLSAVELESIRKELTRQRETLSKRIERHTEINHRMEKEREHVFKQIQDEGKMLIKKCNILRKHGLILKYKIGVKEKEAKELTEEIGAEHAKASMIQNLKMSTDVKLPKRNLELPYIEYRNKNQPRKPLTTEEPHVDSMNPTQFVYQMQKKRAEMVQIQDERHKEIDKLANLAQQNEKAIDEYVVVFFSS